MMKKIKLNTLKKIIQVGSHAVDTLPGKLMDDYRKTMLNGLWTNMPFQIRKGRKYTYAVISGGEDGCAMSWACVVQDNELEMFTAKDLADAHFDQHRENLLIGSDDDL